MNMAVASRGGRIQYETLQSIEFSGVRFIRMHIEAYLGFGLLRLEQREWNGEEEEARAYLVGWSWPDGEGRRQRSWRRQERRGRDKGNGRGEEASYGPPEAQMEDNWAE